MTAARAEFVTPLTFQALSSNPVHCELLDEQAEAGMGHIELARWADLGARRAGHRQRARPARSRARRHGRGRGVDGRGLGGRRLRGPGRRRVRRRVDEPGRPSLRT